MNSVAGSSHMHLLVKAGIGVAVLTVLGGALWLLGTREAVESPVSAPVSSGSTADAMWPADLDIATEVAITDVCVIGRVQGAQSSFKGVTLSKERRTELRAEGYTDAVIDSWVEFEDFVVYTRSEFRISETLKGDFSPGDTVEVRHRGGVYQGETSLASDFAQLQPGREYVVLLSMTFDGDYEVADAWEVQNGIATSTLSGRVRSMSFDELIELIRQHANDPSPFTVAEAVESTTAPEPAPVAAPADETSQTTAP